MKNRLLLTTLCAFAAPLLLASPSPTRAVPETDLLILGDRLNTDIPNQARWESVQAKYESLFGVEQAPIPAEFRPLLKAALGMTPDGKIEDVQSLAVSMTLPKTVEAFDMLDQDQWPDNLGIYCFVEYPEVNLTGVNASINQLLADNPDSGAKLTQNGRWTALTPLDPLEAAGMPLIAWCPIDRGFAVTLCKDYDSAEQAVGNRVAPAPKTPLAEAFKAPSAQGPWGRIVVRDVADLLDRYVTDPVGRQEIMEFMPCLFQVRSLIVTVFYRQDGTFRLYVEAVTDSADGAMQTRDMLITFKVMLRQGIVPQFYGTPYADLFAELIDSATCEVKGNVAVLALSLTPDQAEAILDFYAAQEALSADETPAEPLSDDALYFGDYE